MMMRERSADLVPVHGGLAEPVDRVVSLKQRSQLVAEASKLASVRLTKADLSTVHRIADGTLSPLEGPMGSEAWHRVLDESVVVQGGRRYAWGIPLSLPLTNAEAAALARGASVALQGEAGELVGILDEVECFAWDKPKYVRAVYGTERFDHPGGHMTQNDERTQLVGGRLRTLPQPQHPAWTIFSPQMTRAFIIGFLRLGDDGRVVRGIQVSRQLHD